MDVTSAHAVVSRQLGSSPPADADVRVRPGAYAVLVDASWKVAVVRVGAEGHTHLPGGGIEAGETPLQALHREVLEETGWTVEVRHPLGVVGQYLQHRGAWWNKHCHVWVCRPVAQVADGEADHVLEWWRSSRARADLVHEAYRFVVHRAFGPC